MMDDGRVVTPVRGPKNFSCIHLNDIWMEALDMFYNYYKTPNLNGLKYERNIRN